MEPAKAAQIIVEHGLVKEKARVLVGIDAHLIHHAAKLAGSRYQDFIAMGARKVMPRKQSSTKNESKTETKTEAKTSSTS